MKYRCARKFDPVFVMLVVAALLLAQPSHATVEELAALSLEDLMNVEVTSASKYTQTASEAPSAVTVVSRDDIRRFGWRNLWPLSAVFTPTTTALITTLAYAALHHLATTTTVSNFLSMACV